MHVKIIENTRFSEAFMPKIHKVSYLRRRCIENEIEIRHKGIRRIVMMGCWPGTADTSVPQGRCGNVSASRIFGKESST